MTRNIDPVALERGRMNQLQTAYNHDDGGNVLRGLAYVAFQELATRISHRNTGRYSSDPVADKIMTRIAADENLHMVFYRDMLSEAMKVDPSAAVHAIADEIMDFEMPGSGMVNFTRKAAQMAKAGIYDLRVHHDDVVWPLLTHWGVFELEGLDASAELRRSELRAFLTDLDAQASRFEAKRARSSSARPLARVTSGRVRTTPVLTPPIVCSPNSSSKWRRSWRFGADLAIYRSWCGLNLALARLRATYGPIDPRNDAHTKVQALFRRYIGADGRPNLPREPETSGGAASATRPG